MDAPVEKSVAHRRVRRFRRLRGDARRRRPVVRHRFGHAPEDQADAHAGGEQHGEPAADGKFGLVVLAAEPQVAVTAEGDEGGEQDQSQYHPEVEPAEIAGERSEQRVEHGRHAGGGQDAP
jgi:hypothetical protein